jgi:glycosyltransferase involved in cell wall biosynthesis
MIDLSAVSADPASTPQPQARRLRVVHTAAYFPQYVYTLLKGLEPSAEARAFLGREHFLIDVGEPPSNVILYDVARIKNLKRIARAVPAYRRLLKSFAPDIVHVQETGVDMTALLWRLSSRYPRVLTVHDVILHPGDTATRRELGHVRRMRQSADAFITHSEALKMSLQERNQVPPERIAVIPHPQVIAKLAVAAPFGPGPVTFLMMGRMRNYKGVTVLVQAIERLVQTHPNFRCVFAGTGPAMTEVENLASRAPQVVVLNRFLTGEEMSGLLEASDVLMMPYVEISASGVLGQAMGVGLPTIASRFPVTQASIDDGVSGWLVSPGDPDAFAGAMSRVIENPEQLLAARTAARAKAQEFSPEVIGAQTMRVYEQVLARSKRRRA